MNADDRKFVWGVLSFFAAVGMIMLGVATFAYFKKRDSLAQAVLVAGEVVGLQKSHDVFYPVFRYVTAEERAITFTGNIGSNPPSWRIGDATEVYYDPTFPEDAEVKGFFTQWLVVIITGSLGVAFAIPLSIRLLLEARSRFRLA